jgi:cytoskeletal protein CcmA (bactofilin family)
MGIFGKEQPPAKNLPVRPDQNAPRGTFIGPNIVFDGTITGNENVVIEGAIRGKIQLESDLRIGGSARVEALVHAKNVLVEGALVGDVSADNRVELSAGSRVEGNIKAAKVVVAEGAKFKGAVDMGGALPAKVEPATQEMKEKLNAGNRDQKHK